MSEQLFHRRRLSIWELGGAMKTPPTAAAARQVGVIIRVYDGARLGGSGKKRYSAREALLLLLLLRPS